jgi:pyruvate kinase
MAATTEAIKRRPSETKIVATIGPACASREKLVELIHAGVDVFRINTAHGTHEEHQQRVDDVRAASREAGVIVAVLVDLAGPKIRLGELPGGMLDLAAGSQVRFVRGTTLQQPTDLTTTYARLIDELHPGDRVVLADGTVELVVEQVDPVSATCRVTQPGLLRSRQGVNLPGVQLSVPSLTERDRENAVWAAEAGADFVSLSFVRTADDIHQLKALIQPPGAAVRVIAKMEKPEAVANLEAIVAAADGIMVARGDLGVEIDIAEVPMVQKRIVAACRRAHKPVIVATQMLDSMQHSRLPTRAEATDVANAILDGADACMLSGETAIGEYPREAVEMMHRIALATESVARELPWSGSPQGAGPATNPITAATTLAAGRIAAELHAKVLVIATASGQTALDVAQHRHYVPVIGVSANEAALRRMCLYWGVIPVSGAPTDDAAKLLAWIEQRGGEAGFLASQDTVVLVWGTGLLASRHNAIVVHRVP